MPVIVLDAFNRVAADLTTSPVGRWGAPTGSGGTNAWAADGQWAKTGPTFGASTRGWLRWIGYDSGVNYGELRASIMRSSTNATEVGIFMRSQSNLALHDRLSLIWNGASSRWEIRYYTSATAFALIATATDASTGFAWGTTAHTVRFRVVPANCQTVPNGTACPNPGSTLVLSARVDNLVIFAGVTWPDYFLGGVLSLYRGFGFEVLSAAGWAGATDTVLFDDVEFDSMIAPNHEPMPALVATPTLTPVSITGVEGTASGSLPFTPDVFERVTVQWFEHRTPLVAGYEKTWALLQDARRIWALSNAGRTLTECATMEAFLQAHGGPETPFTFVDDLGVSRVARWTGAIDFTKVGVNDYMIEYLIEEVLP